MSYAGEKHPLGDTRVLRGAGGQDWSGLTFSASSSLVRGVQYALVALGTVGSLYVGRRLISQNGLSQARLTVVPHGLAVAALLGAYVAIFLYS